MQQLAEQIVKEISQKYKITLMDELPTVKWKKGGYSATYTPSTHTITLRENVWTNMSLGGKRMLLIHECLHAGGFDHSTKKWFSNGTADFATIIVYEELYGKDKYYMEVFDQARQILNEMKL
jgi:hypothetical protein